MSLPTPDSIADSTPIIIGAGQYSEAINPEQPVLSSPTQLAAEAAGRALSDAGGSASAADIDCIAMVRLFSDTAPAWKSPFGGSSNPPESVARLIGAHPEKRIYSAAAGSQPLELMAELMGAIYRGETGLALLTGCEAIANQRYALRNNITLDWHEDIDLPMDERQDKAPAATPQEMKSGMFLPVHYYALIENLRAHQRGQDLAALEQAMGDLLASFSQVAADNPHSVRRQALDAAEIISPDNGNYALSLPYRKLQVAQDAVNQSAALLLTSAGRARQLGIDPQKWIFLQAYGEGHDRCLTERVDPARSQAMQVVLKSVIEQTGSPAAELDLVDIYSCFPCAVDAACEALELPNDGSRALTVTGGLPYFGGPGNNYSMHALAEMVPRLREAAHPGLVSANGGILSKHAAAVLGNTPGDNPPDWANGNFELISAQDIAAVGYCDSPKSGHIISYTLIHNRDRPDRAVVLAETDEGLRFLARSEDETLCRELAATSPIGRSIEVTTEEGKHRFSFG